MEPYVKIRIPVTLLLTLVEKLNKHVDRSLESLRIRTKARQLKKEEKLKEYITKQVGEASLDTDAIQEQLKKGVNTVATGKTEIARQKWEARRIVPFKEGNIDPTDQNYFIGIFPKEQIQYAITHYNSYRGYISKSRAEQPSIPRLQDYIVEEFEREITPEREIYFPGKFPEKYAANFNPKPASQPFIPTIPLQPLAVASNSGVPLSISFDPVPAPSSEPSSGIPLGIPANSIEIPCVATVTSE